MRSPWEQVKTVRVMATASFFDPATFAMPRLAPRGPHPEGPHPPPSVTHTVTVTD